MRCSALLLKIIHLFVSLGVLRLSAYSDDPEGGDGKSDVSLQEAEVAKPRRPQARFGRLRECYAPEAEGTHPWNGLWAVNYPDRMRICTAPGSTHSPLDFFVWTTICVDLGFAGRGMIGGVITQIWRAP